mmetsp:Transcript_26800/g.67528  ORF Transcript_26800/g.67528 Transcript_26800/m.67528 type:complete len:711 (-) Transcript_26800:480-2612(-)
MGGCCAKGGAVHSATVTVLDAATEVYNYASSALDEIYVELFGVDDVPRDQNTRTVEEDGWTRVDGVYLNGGCPASAKMGPRFEFDNLRDAKAAAAGMFDCGGVTMVEDYRYQLRVGSGGQFGDGVMQSHVAGETSWLKPATGFAGDDESGDEQPTRNDGQPEVPAGEAEVGEEERQKRLKEQRRLAEEARQREKERVARLENKRKEEAAALAQQQPPEKLQVKCDYGNCQGVFVASTGELELYNGKKHYRCDDHKDVLYVCHDGERWLLTWEEKPEKGSDFNCIALSQKSTAVNVCALRDWNNKGVRCYDYEQFHSTNEPEEGKWTDPEFPPDDSSLASDKWGENVKWVRACNLHRCEKMSLFDAVEPMDAKQGSVGDCWLIAAFAGMAEFPGYIESEIFQGIEDLTADSKYDIKLYNPYAKEWEIVTIDDYLPVWENDVESTIMCKPNGHELYMCLLEKAFAKRWGGYFKLSGGASANGFVALLGTTDCIRYKKKDDYEESGKWRMIYIAFDAEEEPKTYEGGWWCASDDKDLDDEGIWELLRSSDGKNYPMNCAMNNSQKGEIEKEREDGLVEGHAYTLLGAYTLESSGSTTRLLCLRNPWGKHEWNGDWSDESPLWDSVAASALAAAGIERVKKEDGAFYMSFEDFKRCWGRVGITRKSVPVGKAGGALLKSRGGPKKKAAAISRTTLGAIGAEFLMEDVMPSMLGE